MALTKQQRKILETLDLREQSEGSLTTHQIGEVLRQSFRDSLHGYYDRAHASLVRLEKRGLVERSRHAGNRGSSWLIVKAGRDALKA